MSALHLAVDDYISLRRSLGFKLEDYPWMLHDFVSYLETAGAATVTAELAVAWAQRPGQQAHPSYLGKRLCVVRGFARHLAAFDPATEVPSADLLHWQECRAAPYIYSEAGHCRLDGGRSVAGSGAAGSDLRDVDRLAHGDRRPGR